MYKDEAIISGKNPFYDAVEEFNVISTEVWQRLLNSINSDRSGIETNDIPDTSVFGTILKPIDLNNNSSGEYSKALESAIKMIPTEKAYWNESVDDLVKLLFAGSEENDISPLNPEKNFFRVWDIKHADAGFSFKEEPWVVPWLNKDLKSYSEIRGADSLAAVLKNERLLHFTNANADERERVAVAIRASRIFYDEDTNSVDFSSSYKGELFNIFSYDDEGVLTPTYIENLYSYVSGVINANGIARFMNEEEVQNFADSRNKWIRLLMPMYERCVEVEDLNRNFWVIGQVITSLLHSLFDPDGMIKKFLNIIGAEIEELWNNTDHLWGAVLANCFPNIPDEITWHVQLLPMGEMLNEFYYTTAGSFAEQIPDRDSDSDFFYSRVEQFLTQYPQQNIAIIPTQLFDLDKDEKANGHRAFHKIKFAGILLLERYSYTPEGKVQYHQNAKFKWANQRTVTIDAEELVPKVERTKVGTGYKESGLRLQVVSLNNLAANESNYTMDFYVTPQIKHENGTWSFEKFNIFDAHLAPWINFLGTYNPDSETFTKSDFDWNIQTPPVSSANSLYYLDPSYSVTRDGLDHSPILCGFNREETISCGVTIT